MVITENIASSFVFIDRHIKKSPLLAPFGMGVYGWMFVLGVILILDCTL